MLYLSRLYPNLRNHSARRDLADPYQIHRTLMRAFPSATAGGPGRVLWRVDQVRNPVIDSTAPVVLVQSEKAPDWSALDVNWTTRPPEQKTLSVQLRAGQRLRFRLRANPTKRVGRSAVDQAWVGKRIALLDPSRQIAWLARQADRAGCRLLQVAPHPALPEPVYAVADRPEGRTIAHKTDRQTGEIREVIHHAVLFEGLLEITDATAFTTALTAGIGPAKAFGFGLLSVARA